MSDLHSRPTYARQDSVSGVDVAALAPKASPDVYGDDSKSQFNNDDKTVPVAHLNPADEEYDDLDARNKLANGKERPIETAEDIATR